jgi:hypothetical protein
MDFNGLLGEYALQYPLRILAIPALDIRAFCASHIGRSEISFVLAGDLLNFCRIFYATSFKCQIVAAVFSQSRFKIEIGRKSLIYNNTRVNIAITYSPLNVIGEPAWVFSLIWEIPSRSYVHRNSVDRTAC